MKEYKAITVNTSTRGSKTVETIEEARAHLGNTGGHIYKWNPEGLRLGAAPQRVVPGAERPMYDGSWDNVEYIPPNWQPEPAQI